MVNLGKLRSYHAVQQYTQQFEDKNVHLEDKNMHRHKKDGVSKSLRPILESFLLIVSRDAQ